MTTTLFASVDKYISNLLAKEDETLIAITKSNEAAGLPQWHISPNQGKFLQVMARLCNAKKILELGTLGGYSTYWLAKALPADGKLISIEADPAFAAISKHNMQLANLDKIVDIRTGKALDVLHQIEAEGISPFDMIFIDADKPPYVEYFQWALKLSRPGTMIIADNVIREGKVLDENSTDEKVQGVQRLNQFLATNTGVTATIITSVGGKEYDGMGIAVVN